VVRFDPPLPEWKKEAIARFRPVYFTKIFLKFPRDFWDDHEWIMHVSEKPGNFPTFFDLDRSGFFPGYGILIAHSSNRRRSIESGEAKRFRNVDRSEESSAKNVRTQYT